MDDERSSSIGRISRDTLIPIGVVATVVASVVVGSMWLSGRLLQIDYGLDVIRTDVRRLVETQEDVVRRGEFAAWLEILRARNPDRTYPDLPRQK